MTDINFAELGKKGKPKQGQVESAYGIGKSDITNDVLEQLRLMSLALEEREKELSNSKAIIKARDAEITALKGDWGFLKGQNTKLNLDIDKYEEVVEQQQLTNKEVMDISMVLNSIHVNYNKSQMLMLDKIIGTHAVADVRLWLSERLIGI